MSSVSTSATANPHQGMNEPRPNESLATLMYPSKSSIGLARRNSWLVRL